MFKSPHFLVRENDLIFSMKRNGRTRNYPIGLKTYYEKFEFHFSGVLIKCD